MESSKLTDEELIELAKQETELDKEEDDVRDVKYYQERFTIKDGKYKVFFTHLYKHYHDWSSDPVSESIFKDFLNIKQKNNNFCCIDFESCTINIGKMIGDYVKEKRSRQKEKRFRQVPSFKPKT